MTLLTILGGASGVAAPFSGTPISLHALDTWTLLHAAAPAGTGNVVTLSIFLTDQDGNRLIDQDGNYLTAYAITTAFILHADETQTLRHTESAGMLLHAEATESFLHG